MIDLKKIKEDTGANMIVVADKEGKVIDSLDAEYDSNIALMTETVFSMCRDLSKDLFEGNLEQLVAKSPEGYFIVNRLGSDSVILLLSKDLSKFGLLLKYVSTIEK
ncbi:roadblock/LC7 domain-containing protein [Aquimarina sediminis]|uniref:roadblock/LC7 domain-containing protein n=1 Tax=Aquimarina sediminis TaxID=2070536 RepID=UPI000CA0776F|nr:roadblock/LC7 domain-containing protein [Aquimarina sediminis]